jgi:PBSX family phage terminase large subunit
MLNLDSLPLSRKQITSIVEAQSTPQLALWSGAVAAGKTIASLLAFLITITTAPESGLVVMVGRTLQTIERNLIDPLQDARLFGPLARHVHHTPGSSTAVILGRTVHLIGAADSRAEGRIRGSTIALAYIDEASLLPEAFWVMMLSRLRVPGAKLFATTNPASPAHYLRRDYILRSAEVGMRYWHFTLNDNPGLEPEFVERLKRQYVGLYYRRFILGEWIAAEGSIYSMFDPDLHVIDIVPPITQWVAVGIDYGSTNPFHATLLGVGAENDEHGQRQECLYAVSEWRWDSRQRHRALTDVEYSRKLREWLASVRFPGTRLHGPAPEYLVIDPSAASFKTQCFQDGWNVVDGDNSVLDGIRLVSSLLAAKRLKFSRSGCPELLDELPGYAWDDQASLRGEDKPIKSADHGCDSLRYGVKTTQGLWHNRIRLAAAA